MVFFAYRHQPKTTFAFFGAKWLNIVTEMYRKRIDISLFFASPANDYVPNMFMRITQYRNSLAIRANGDNESAGKEERTIDSRSAANKIILSFLESESFVTSKDVF